MPAPSGEGDVAIRRVPNLVIGIGLITAELAIATACGHAESTLSPRIESEGTVQSIQDGVIHFSITPYHLVVLKTASGNVTVAVPISTTTPIHIGESIAFSGTNASINSQNIIDTSAGYVFRPAEQDYQQYIANMMNQAQQQAQKAQRTGTPNAVPTVTMQTAQQAQSATEQRNTDLTLSVLSLLVGILALERLTSAFFKFCRWITSPFRRRRGASHHAGT